MIVDANPAATVPAIVPSAVRGGLVLAYHRVADLAPDTHRLCVPPDRFQQHMRYLRQHYTPMPLVELFRAARDGALPPRAVAVTLDDGYLDALTTAAPILAKEDVPATFFVNTERLTVEHEAWHDQIERLLLGDAMPPVLEIRRLHLDVKTPEQRREALMALHGALMSASAADREELLDRLIRWSGRSVAPRPERRVLLADEVAALSRVPGCEIGSHSEHHLLLPQHPEQVQRAELYRAKERLEALLDRPVVSFAYPFGAHDEPLEEVARSIPHLLAVTVEPGLVTASTDPMRLPRLEISDGEVPALAAAIQRVRTSSS